MNPERIVNGCTKFYCNPSEILLKTEHVNFMTALEEKSAGHQNH